MPPIPSGSELDQFCRVLDLLGLKWSKTDTWIIMKARTVISVTNGAHNCDFHFRPSDEKFIGLEVYPVRLETPSSGFA